MDVLNGEPGSSNDSCLTSTLDGNEVIGTEDGRLSEISEVADQETTTIPGIKTEPNLQMASTLPPCKRRKDVCSEPSVIASQLRSINDLPDEILLKILSHLEPEDLCFNIAKVCERWNGFAKDVVLWKTLSYYCDHSSECSEIEEVLKKAPALHSLTIDEHSDAGDILEFIFHIGDLRKLTIKGCWLGDDPTGFLSILVALYPNLEGLSLTGCSPLSFDEYCLIGHLKKLSELDLSECEYLSGESIRLIADSCQHLKNLRLCDVRLNDDDVIHVIDKLGKQLTTLGLDGTDLTDVAFSYLKNFARLQELEVFYCETMTDRGLLEGIGSLHELTALCLSRGRNLTAQALTTFLHRPSMSSIVLLDLSDCSNLDDEGLKGIAERCIHLKVLRVCWSDNVTDAGISMVVSHCSQMCELFLKVLPSVRGEGWLALVPSHLPHLRRLYLLFCYNLVRKYVEELRAALPELEISI